METPEYALYRGLVKEVDARGAFALDNSGPPSLPSLRSHRRSTYEANEERKYSPLASNLKATVESMVGIRFHKAMWNWYRGRYDLGGGHRYHHDVSFGAIAVISLGSPARFTFESCARPHLLHNIMLYHGDVLFIPEHTQRTYAHGVFTYGNRASLILREDVEPWEQLRCGHGT